MSPPTDIQSNRVMACRLARRTSDDFSENYGESALDSIAPFEGDEVQLGHRAVGSGAFASVFPIKGFNLRANKPKKILGASYGGNYTREQIQKREAADKSAQNGVQYVIKSLKDKLEDENELFLESAQDIVSEAEMLAAFCHPNIIQLHGIIASLHDSFAEGPSAFFLVLERLESTLDVKIEEWKKQNSFNPSRSINSLRSSMTGSMTGSMVGVIDNNRLEKSTAGEGGSLDGRLRLAASLASAIKYLHSKDVIFHDLKPGNVGVDKRGHLKLFDFGLAKFMPRHGDSYKDVYEMNWAGTPRYSAPEVVIKAPYNLKADVYSFSVVLWEMVGLKQPFPKCKKRIEFEQALPKLDKILAIDRRWPVPIQDIIKRGLSKDLSERPTMKEVHNTLDEFVTNGVEDSDAENSRTQRTTRRRRASSFALGGSMRKLGSSIVSSKSNRRRSDGTGSSDITIENLIEEVSRIEQ
eukprot:scaffold3521_cov160-Skeletonema_menzelii.AAC.3